MNVRLSLIVLRCKNLEASLNFYQRLGLRFVQERHGEGPFHYAASLNDMVIELYPQREPFEHSAPTRIGFVVNSLSDSLCAMQEIGAPITSRHVKRAIVLDPDGRAVELTE